MTNDKDPHERDTDEFAAIKHAVHWLGAIYSSEVFFLFGLPLLLVHQPSFDAVTSSKAPLSFRQKIQRWWKSISDRKHREKFLLTGSSDYSYAKFAVLMVFLTVVGSAFKLTALGLITTEAAEIKSTTTSQFKDYTDIVFKWENGRWFVAAVVVHFVQYLVHLYHLAECIVSSTEARREDAILNLPMYAFAHLSIVNFSLDLPGSFIANVRLTNSIVILINIVGISMLFFLWFAEKPISECWGCYPPWFNINEYKYGPCPAFLSKHNPENALAAVCTDVNGARCDTEATRWTATLAHAWSIARILLFTSGSFYIWSIPTKVEYYSTKYRMALRIADKIRRD